MRNIYTRLALTLVSFLTVVVPTITYATTVPGGIYTWRAPAGASDFRFQNKPVMHIGNDVYVGIPLSFKPGQAILSYNTNAQQQNHAFTVVAKTYSEQHLTIANKAMVDPPKETQDRIAREAIKQKKLYNSFSTPVDLDRGFKLPLEGVTTSLFGHRRFFNGKPRSPHSGLDIAGDTGAPIQAAGNATVVLAEPLYFNGNTLFLDHGQGLITMYCHLSDLKAEVGNKVMRGEIIGLVGATGRVTGPHLHWSVSLNGYRIDPSTFMQLLNRNLRSE